MVVFGQNVYTRAKVAVLGQKCLYSGKSSCVGAILIVFGQMWLYSGKVVVFGQKNVLFL